ncbi:hypothetical protein [Kitasatospora sp. NPDC093806]|uniref:hypothetical protein n=1 Tax=Kitasatospora sp. NPDC093806 TaxID=3155075 RepID=UPI00341F4C8E
MRVRPPGSRALGRWGKGLLAVGLAWAVAGVSAILPLGAGTVTEAVAASATTVTGPPVWIPATGKYGPTGKVTVSETANLTNQVVHVSWEGFTPTVDPAGKPVKYVKLDSNTRKELYAVRVYQCRGKNPTVFDCYGSTHYGNDAAKGFLQPQPAAGTRTPEFPFNGGVRVTGPDGRGEADIELWTSQESQTLGCDATHDCSLVVEANYGGDALGWSTEDGSINCQDHSLDNPSISGYFAMASEATFNMGAAADDTWNPGEACAWANRVVVPLSFAPTAGECASTTIDLDVAGLAMANRALQQWRAGFCQGAAPLGVSYIPSTGEPQARAAFRNKRGPDLALTALPDTEPATRPHVYVPLATSSVSVVYVVDDTANSKQIKRLNLTPRLLAKMLTQSYTLAPGQPIDSVAGNPTCIFEDPDFLAVNQLDATSGERWPTCTASGSPADSAPIVLSGTTDLIYQLTSWITADPEAARFLQGSSDPWGMHLNSFYLRPAFQGYPVDTIQVQDYSGPGHWKQFEINPLNGGLAAVARNVLQNKSTCQLPVVDADGKHAACPAVDPGRRGMFAIMDSGQAKAYSFPEAALRNPAGQFVAPTLDSLQAAVDTMQTDPATATQRLPYGSVGSEFARSAKAYPLTVVQYAMAPTGGLSEERAKAASEFLRRVTDRGEGQRYGVEPGHLAVGFLGLTPAQLDQAQDAVKHVAAQDGKYPGNQNPPAPEPTPTPTPESTPTPAPTTGGDGGTSGTGGTGGTPVSGTTGGGTSGSVDGTGTTGTAGATGTGGTTGSTGGTGSVTSAVDGSTDTTGSGSTGSGSTGSGSTGSASSGSGGSGSSGSGIGTGSGSLAGTTGAVPAPAAGAGTPAPAAKPTAAPAASPAATSSTAGRPIAAAPVAAGAPAPDRSGSARLLLPIALIAGVVLLVGGPAALLLAGTPAGARAAAGASGLWARLRPGRRA